MRSAEQQRIEKEINGCQITLSFSAKPVDGVRYSLFYQKHMMSGCRMT